MSSGESLKTRFTPAFRPCCRGSGRGEKRLVVATSKPEHMAVEILEHLGSRCRWEGGSLVVDHAMTCCQVPPELMREMRSSIVFLGPIVSRCGQAELCFPGGCELGPRPIDLHIDALRRLGVDIEDSGGRLYCCAPEGIRGTYISLAFPSVGPRKTSCWRRPAPRGPR